MSETTPSYDYTAALVRINAEHFKRSRLEAEIGPSNQVALFDALHSAGITSVVVTFDGYGDSGQIESIEALAGETATPIPIVQIEVQRVLPDASGVAAAQLSIREAIENLAYDLIEETHPGWENNDGAYGEFVFDVAARTITLNHNERFTDIQSFSHAWGE